MAKLEHLKQGQWKIYYWLKTPTKEGTEVTDPIPIFIDCEPVMDEDDDEEMEWGVTVVVVVTAAKCVYVCVCVCVSLK